MHPRLPKRISKSFSVKEVVSGVEGRHEGRGDKWDWDAWCEIHKIIKSQDKKNKFKKK